MILSQSIDNLEIYISQQINNYFPDKNKIEYGELSRNLKISLERLKYAL